MLSKRIAIKALEDAPAESVIVVRKIASSRLDGLVVNASRFHDSTLLVGFTAVFPAPGATANCG